MKVLCLCQTIMAVLDLGQWLEDLRGKKEENFELGKASQLLVKRNPVSFLFSSLLFELFV